MLATIAWQTEFSGVLAAKLAQKACCHTLYKRGTMDFGVFWPPSWPRRLAATLSTSVALWILVCFGHQVGPEGLLPHLVQAWHYGFWGGLAGVRRVQEHHQHNWDPISLQFRLN